MDRAYRERLLPRWWVWLVAVAFATMLGIAYGAALGTASGWLVGAGAVALVIWLLWITSPVVRVDSSGLSVAGAVLPDSAIGQTRVVESAELRDRAGPTSDARLFTALRPWSASGAVLVRVEDNDDPHPAWLFTSRHPARVIEAITGTM